MSLSDLWAEYDDLWGDVLPTLAEVDAARQAIEDAIAEDAVVRALVRMKQLGILVDKVRNPRLTARALLERDSSGDGE